MTTVTRRQYNDPNDFPVNNKDDIDLPVKDLPDFIVRIMKASCVTIDGKIYFMRKFGLEYLKSKKFRELSNECIFFCRWYVCRFIS